MFKLELKSHNHDPDLRGRFSLLVENIRGESHSSPVFPGFLHVQMTGNF